MTILQSYIPTHVRILHVLNPKGSVWNFLGHHRITLSAHSVIQRRGYITVCLCALFGCTRDGSIRLLSALLSTQR